MNTVYVALPFYCL